MARQRFGGGTSDYVADPMSGRPRSGVAVTFWTAETGGSQVTDLLLAGGPVSSVTSGPAGRIPVFDGPDEVYALWAVAAGGTVRSRIDAQRIDLTAVLEGVPLTAYGMSYPEGFGTTDGAGYVERIGHRFRMTPVVNAAVGGDQMAQTVGRMLSGLSSSTFVPGTQGIVLIDSIINNVRLYGTNAAALTAFKESLDLACRIARSFGKYEVESHASVTGPAGGWTTNIINNPEASGSPAGNAIFTTVAGDYRDIAFTGDSLTVITYRLKAGLSAGSLEFLNGATLLATVSCANGLPSTAPISFHAVPVTLSGFGPGAHTVRVRKAAGNTNPVYLDAWLAPSATPPTVVVVKDVPLASYLGTNNPAPYNNGSDAAIDAYAAAVDEVVAALDGNVITADPRTGWDKTSMILPDAIHPNDKGHSHYAGAITRALTAVAFRDGQNTL